MRTLGGLFIALVMAGGLFAQFRGDPGYSGATPRLVGGFGSVVFPGGTPATNPNITRNFGSVVFPGGYGPQIVIPGQVTGQNFAQNLGVTVGGRNMYRNDGRGANGRRPATAVYAYPVYIGGVYDSSYAYPIPAAVPPEPAQAPVPQNITVIYPPQQPAARPEPEESNFRTYQAPFNQPAEPAASAPEDPHYLLAFKDHTIYSAIAYWVDGDTLHYFTAGNKHNQASISLVDRALTDRLNKETGAAVVLPAEK